MSKQSKSKRDHEMVVSHNGKVLQVVDGTRPFLENLKRFAQHHNPQTSYEIKPKLRNQTQAMNGQDNQGSLYGVWFRTRGIAPVNGKTIGPGSHGRWLTEPGPDANEFQEATSAKGGRDSPPDNLKAFATIEEANVFSGSWTPDPWYASMMDVDFIAVRPRYEKTIVGYSTAEITTNQ